MTDEPSMGSIPILGIAMFVLAMIVDYIGICYLVIFIVIAVLIFAVKIMYDLEFIYKMGEGDRT